MDCELWERGQDGRGPMTSLRAFRPGDEDALAEICLRTAASGADATGLLDDDAIWAEVYVLPYAARHPDFAFVIETDEGHPVGYVVGAPDTEEFERWFRDQWWPHNTDRWPEPGAGQTRQDRILRYAYARGSQPLPVTARYPAHLHIDLLPDVQGQGWGRQLIDALVARLRSAGVTGLHLVAGADNASALAFYRRLGFTDLPSDEGAQTMGLLLL